MVEIDAVYSGAKKCALTHPDGATLVTDAPRDIGGDASAFSPTDLVASGLASCILTTIAMFAERRDIDITGAKAIVQKEMNKEPRRIGRLPVRVTLPASIPEELRPAFEKVGRSCPVHASLHPEIDAQISYFYE